MTKTTTETTMTEVDKVFQVAARRIQGLTAKVNHWKQRANELEAALGTEKAARIEAEATLSKTVNSWVGQVDKPDRDALAAQVRRLESVMFCPHCGHKLEAVPCEPSVPTPRSHPVRVGEWVEFAGKKSKVVSVGAAGYSLDGQRYCLFSDCTPCDPPEATEQMMLRREREFAVKEAADNAVEESENDTAQGDDIKVGDYVEVFQSTDANWTLENEIGIEGTVQRIEMTAHSIPIVLLSDDGAYALRDVRRIQREPKPGDKVRLVNTPVKWESEWGKIGDVGTVKEVSACDDTVRTQETGYWWSVDRIEIVDAK